MIWGITNDDEIVGLEDVESDAEFISETIKTKIDSIPKVNLRFHMEDNKKLILLDVYSVASPITLFGSIRTNPHPS